MSDFHGFSSVRDFCCMESGAPSYPLTPTQMQIICLRPWMYGSPGDEWGESFVFVRIIAVASRAACPATAQKVARVDPVVGFIGPSSGDAASAQLIESCEIHHFARNGDFALLVGLGPISKPGSPPPTTRFQSPPMVSIP